MSSRRSLKVTVLDTKLRLVAHESVQFDFELPHYKTRDDVHQDWPRCSGRVSCLPLMWVEALELLLEKLVKAERFLLEVRAISGNAQQHGSLYWREGVKQMLQSLNPSCTLASQLKNVFSMENTPIWMDNNSTQQCRNIEEALGGVGALTELTGSCALERYIGPQIKKLYQTQEGVYNVTEIISLISLFMTCLLIGDYGCIDYTDRAGMSLMDLRTHKWMPTTLHVGQDSYASHLSSFLFFFLGPISTIVLHLLGVIHLLSSIFFSCLHLRRHFEEDGALQHMCTRAGI